MEGFQSFSPSSTGPRDSEPALCTSPSVWCTVAHWPGLFLVRGQKDRQLLGDGVIRPTVNDVSMCKDQIKAYSLSPSSSAAPSRCPL